MRPSPLRRSAVQAIGLVVTVIVTAGMSCDSKPDDGPSPPNNNNNNGVTACRTLAATSTAVQTFADGQVVTTSMTCSFNASNNEATCEGPFTDSLGGPGTIHQTSRFVSRGDLVDEAATNPPLTRSLGTTTVTTSGGLAVTLTATHGYDAQRRLVSTVLDNSLLPQSSFSYTAWDGSGRPTAGTLTSFAGVFPLSISYDNANRTVTRNTGLNICTVTHDQNGNIVRESCTGTTPSVTEVTIHTTTQVCR